MTTGYIWDKIFLGHKNSKMHPENPFRVDDLDFHSMRQDLPGLVEVINQEALGRPAALRIHSNKYLQRFERDATNGLEYFDYFDTKLREDTFEVALRSVSAAVSLTSAVCKGEVKNGFAAIRPPGHHATPEKAKGFCFFNNVAICARHAQMFFDCKKVLIVDWDVHPGDGTTSIFYDDPDVHVLSIHQDGIFSESVGTDDQRGRGEGEGTTYNVSLKERSNMTDYLRAFEPAVINAVERCKPDIIFISCGFDAHRGDPLGSMELDEDAFQRFTQIIMSLAAVHCNGRIVSILEGGYNTDILQSCVRSHVEILMG